MDSFSDDEITRLLRLKRYEQPPPGYFENFLYEFRRRQRDKLLRQPLWSICIRARTRFCVPAQCPSVRILLRRRRGSGRVRRSNFNHDLSATRRYSIRSPELARPNQATEYRERIGLRASGVDSSFRHAAGCSPSQTAGIFGCCRCCRLTRSGPMNLSRSSSNGNHSTISHCKRNRSCRLGKVTARVPRARCRLARLHGAFVR